jgi:hypothetical protein
MADLVKFGPFTVYKSPAYEEAVRQQQADAAAERETKKMQQDYLRAQIEEFNAKQEYLKSPEGQASLQAEREKEILGVQKIKSELEAEAEKKRRAAPGYSEMEAARLSGQQAELRNNLETQQGLLEDVQNRVSDIKSKQKQYSLPEGIAGPTMSRDMATRIMRPALETEASMQQMIPGTSAALASTRKQLGELTGTVPIPEEFGGGTAPATNIKSIYEERERELIPLKKNALDYINTLTPGTTEHAAAVQTYDKFSGYTNAETKRMEENSRKIPGFGGIAYTVKGAEAVRSDLGDFVPSIQGIDSLLELGQKYRETAAFTSPQDKLRYMARADAIIAGLRGSLRKPLVGGGNPSDADQEIIRKALADPTALVNAVGFSPGNFAPEKLGELKQAIARRFMASAKANGFNADSIQSILDANRDPKDITSFKSKKPNEFNSEEEARAAGYGDGDSVIIKGQSGTLTPRTQ